WKVALRLAVSAVFLVVLFTRVPDLHGLSLPDDHPLRTTLLLGFAIVAACVGIVLSAWRWQQVLRLFDASVPLGTLTRHYFAGRFAANENWTRFIGAVFLGVDRARRDPGQAVIVLAAAIVYQLSIVGAYALIFRALDVSVPIAAAFAFVPAVSMLQVIPLSF